MRRDPVKDTDIAIMDIAERRMRLGGYAAFSYREIAAEIGIKSSSVHYYFPSKEDLAAKVIARYAERVAALFDEMLATDPNPVRVWTQALATTAHSETGMCPGTLLGAMTGDLPEKVLVEVRRFFRMNLDKLVAAGLTVDAASEVVSALMGALVVANALGDPTLYDRAAAEHLRRFEAAA